MHVPYDGKIRIFHDSVIVATTGPIGHSQRLHVHVDEAIVGGLFRGKQKVKDSLCGISTRVLADFQKSMVTTYGNDGLRFGALMAVVINNEPFLVEYGTTDFQPEIKDGNLFYVSMGSGQVLADPFLQFVSRVMWGNKMPTVDDAQFGVYWVLNHTLQLAPGKVGPPIRLTTLRQIEGKWVASEEDVQQANEYVTALEKHIGGFANQAPIEAEQAEPIPKPAPSPGA
jgi:hypothetical protein